MASGRVARDHFVWWKVRPYLVYVCMFVATIYANMRALQHSNVETIIVFRACCPLIVSILDWGFLGRQLPSCRSVLALVVLVGGCAGYVLTDKAFKLNGIGAYTWVGAYFVIISVEMAYGKHIVGPHLQFASMWGPTLYTNMLSVPPMLAVGVLAHEQDQLAAMTWTAPVVLLVLLSCVIGVAISYLGWRARSLVTATCYTVLGACQPRTGDALRAPDVREARATLGRWPRTVSARAGCHPSTMPCPLPLSPPLISARSHELDVHAHARGPLAPSCARLPATAPPASVPALAQGLPTRWPLCWRTPPSGISTRLYLESVASSSA